MHLHAVVEYATKLNIRDPNFFDFNGLHGNYQGCKYWANCVAYCTKDGDFITDVQFDDTTYENFSKRRQDYEEWLQYKKLKQLKSELKQPDIELKDWQKEVITLLKEDVKKRRVIWIWSEGSGTGKSTLLDYIAFDKKVLSVSTTDLNQIVYLYNFHDIIWFDIPRNALTDNFYYAIESLSNNPCILYHTKYRGGEKVVKAHIVVSCNYEPPHHKIPNRIVEVKATY